MVVSEHGGICLSPTGPLRHGDNQVGSPLVFPLSFPPNISSKPLAACLQGTVMRRWRVGVGGPSEQRGPCLLGSPFKTSLYHPGEHLAGILTENPLVSFADPKPSRCPQTPV
ncbi:hypothetical protein Q8A67_020479 [Cirrhinus molitorella]|uniref:Uncharacterized protein n=1 Tax=Cirrhinus molitorella TaxID=172907 RepID=A0AA88P5B4_9TELE|nr:hypothetical protein Q8A67_020479 [Cirrhinus molitorella]